jgi:hypothetical protein
LPGEDAAEVIFSVDCLKLLDYVGQARIVRIFHIQTTIAAAWKKNVA